MRFAQGRKHYSPKLAFNNWHITDVSIIIMQSYSKAFNMKIARHLWSVE